MGESGTDGERTSASSQAFSIRYDMRGAFGSFKVRFSSMEHVNPA